MPGITEYVLKGGPCDGNTGVLTPEIDSSKQVICGDHVYKTHGKISSGVPREIFNDAGPVPKPKTGLKAPQAQRGWTDMQRSINRKMPKALHASARLRAQALRDLSRVRKVKH